MESGAQFAAQHAGKGGKASAEKEQQDEEEENRNRGIRTLAKELIVKKTPSRPPDQGQHKSPLPVELAFILAFSSGAVRVAVLFDGRSHI